MRELLRVSAHFPDASIGLLPDRADVLRHRPLELPDLRAFGHAALPTLMQSVHQLSVDVELELSVRRVADAHRFRLRIAREPRNLPLVEHPFARDAVHDLQLLRTARGRAQQPVTP